jgi:GT2 family glycosyltransferase
VSAPVAVAVVSWNTRELLERCLAALEADVRAGLAEVWVVDNGSTDGSPGVVPGWATLVEPGENLGFGRAVNLVAGRTSSQWLVAANADTAPEPGALRELIAAGERDLGAGALAPRLILPDGSTQHSVFAFPTLPFLALYNAGFGAPLGDRLCLEGRWDPGRARRVPWAVGAFLMLRRAAFDAAGGFDPVQWMYAEDVDLGWRLRDAGWATRHVPAARVLHESAASTAVLWGEERTLRWQAATYDWLRRRRGPVRARAAYALNVSGSLVRARLGRGWQAERARGWKQLHRDAWRAPPPSAS